MAGLVRQFLGLLLVLWALSSAEGGSLPFEGLDDLCGPYAGTGSSGEALHVQPLGDAGQWRICAYWSSARTESSPWLGYGWSIPALESRFVPLDERRWAFHQPDGYVRIFVRTGHDDGVLHLSGGSAWTAGLRKLLVVGRRWIPIVLAACTLVGAAVWTGFAGRVADSSPTADASVGNRLAIWRNVPCMMVDAPGGWGYRSSQVACC